jgi:hypothetical protein
VRIGHRKRGVTCQLIAAALKAARRAKAPALEAYPFDADLSPSFGLWLRFDLRQGRFQDCCAAHTGTSHHATQPEGHRAAKVVTRAGWPVSAAIEAIAFVLGT